MRNNGKLAGPVFIRTSGLAIFLLAVTVMAGWFLHNQVLVQISPAFEPMKFNTALGFLFCGLGLMTLDSRFSRLSGILGSIAGLIGLMTLSQYVFKINFGIDTIFMNAPLQNSPRYAGRMTPYTAINFILAGGFLFAWSFKSKPPHMRLPFAAAIAGSLIIGLATTPFIAYLTGIDPGTNGTFLSGMALHTAIAFFLLGANIIVCALRAAGRIPLWLPVPVFIALVAISTSLWLSLEGHEASQLQNLVETRAESTRAMIHERLTDMYGALDRMDNRWEAEGGTPRSVWESDAQASLRSYPVLDGLSWADPTSRVQWLASRKNDKRVIGWSLESEPKRAEAIRKARQTRQPHTTAVVDLFGGAGKGFLYINPLYIGDRYDGLLLGVFNVDNLFKGLLSEDDFLNNFWISIYEGPTRIFTNIPRGQDNISGIVTTSDILIGDKKWDFSISPKPAFLAKEKSRLPLIIFLVGLQTAVLICLTLFIWIKLRISQERFELAWRGAGDGMWDWTVATNEVVFSDRMKELMGYESYELRHHFDEWAGRLHQDDKDKTLAALNAHILRHDPYDVEYRLITKSGAWRWYRAKGQAIWDAQGRPVRMAGSLTDITERKKMERMKSEFISTVSHELRTPLTSIRGSLGFLKAGIVGALAPKAVEMVDIADRNCGQLILLINDILDIDKMESGQMRFDLKEEKSNALIQQAVDSNRAYGEKFGIRFTIEPCDQDVLVNVDASRLIQVLSNLLSNAAKFSVAGDEVRIKATHENNKTGLCS